MEGETGQTNNCKRCNKDKKIYCRELCKSCYNYLVINKDKQKEYQKNWKEKNADYFKKYYLNNKEKKNE